MISSGLKSAFAGCSARKLPGGSLAPPLYLLCRGSLPSMQQAVVTAVRWMVTDWPEGSPGTQSNAVRLAQTVGDATGGRIKIEVYPSGALVRPFETFDAVGAGVADMYHTDEAYFEKKSPAFNFFAAIPFGFTADELFAWVQY